MSLDDFIAERTDMVRSLAVGLRVELDFTPHVAQNQTRGVHPRSAHERRGTLAMR